MGNGILEAKNLRKTYWMGEIEVHALRGASFTIEEGEFVVILGPSGSGKSTLLNILGGMDTPSEGEAYISGQLVTGLSEKELTEFRRNKVGFVFQFYNVMASLTARENVELATEISLNPLDIDEIMEVVGLADRADHFPSQMSGGEQQRVSIARAIAKNPDILLCDEPTGALDLNTGVAILSLLSKLHRELKKTVIVITHNSDIASMADRVIHMRSGEILENTVNKHPLSPEEVTW